MAKAKSKSVKQTWRVFEVGTEVAVLDGFTGETHIGKIVSVTRGAGGYPETVVDFPTKGGAQKWAVEKLKTPEELEQHIKNTIQMFPAFASFVKAK